MEIICTAEEIAREVTRLGSEITRYYQGKPLTVIALMNGAIPFAADLMRTIDLPIRVDTLAVASYRDCRSTGKPELRSTLKLPVAGRHLLVLDEVLDTGRTFHCILDYLDSMGALSVRSAVLVEKELARPDGLAHADWAAFTLPDRYLVGYGLDADEEYRNLPYVAAL